MAIAVDWLDAYRAARINQIVGMHSPDAVIEVACGGRKVIHGQEASRLRRHRFIEMLVRTGRLAGDGDVVAISYRTSNGTVQALDIAENG
jgi:hypothetical protein